MYAFIVFMLLFIVFMLFYMLLHTDLSISHSNTHTRTPYTHRFWFQEYVPANAKNPPKGTTRPTTASHYNLPRIYFQTEANAGESRIRV